MAMYPESLFQEIADPDKRAFLAAYAHTGRITRAALSAQVNWRNHYNWLKSDEQYVLSFAEAQRMAGDFFEDEAIRRALEGIQKPVFYRGEHVENETVYSDTLMIVLLKGAKPDKYRDNVKVETDITVHLETSLQQGVKRLELLRGDSDRTRIA